MLRYFGALDRTAAGRKARRLLTLPTSVLLHAVAVGLLVVVPLLVSQELPKPAQPAASPLAIHATLVAPPPPPPPAPAAHPKASEVKVRKPRPRPTPAAETKKLVAPVEVQPLPEPETDVLGMIGNAVAGGSPHGVPGGVEGGVPGGVEGGVPGGIEGGVPGGVVGGVIGGVPTAVPAPVEPVRVGGQIEAPRKLRHVAPEYPDLARRAGVQAVVILEAMIDTGGRVSHVRVLRGHPLLDEAALQAVRRWAYVPTLLNGVPVPVILTVTVNFRLE
jgi:protein TonB